MKSFNYLIYYILYQVIKNIMSISSKNMRQLLIILQKNICKKIRKKNTFEIKAEYYLEFLTHETMKLLWSIKSKINKDKNDENVPHSEITEVVLIYCNIVNNDYQRDSRALYKFVSNKSVAQLWDILPQKICIFRNFLFRTFIYWIMVYWSKF